MAQASRFAGTVGEISTPATTDGNVCGTVGKTSTPAVTGGNVRTEQCASNNETYCPANVADDCNTQNALSSVYQTPGCSQHTRNRNSAYVQTTLTHNAAAEQDGGEYAACAQLYAAERGEGSRGTDCYGAADNGQTFPAINNAGVNPYAVTDDGNTHGVLSTVYQNPECSQHSGDSNPAYAQNTETPIPVCKRNIRGLPVQNATSEDNVDLETTKNHNPTELHTGRPEVAPEQDGGDLDPSIQHYAARYGEGCSDTAQNRETFTAASGADATPYAVAYMGEDDVVFSRVLSSPTLAGEPTFQSGTPESQQGAGKPPTYPEQVHGVLKHNSNFSPNVQHRPSFPNVTPAQLQNGMIPNQMSVPNRQQPASGMIANKLYVPNIQQQASGCRHRRIYVVLGAAVAMVILMGGVLLRFLMHAGKTDVQKANATKSVFLEEAVPTVSAVSTMQTVPSSSQEDGLLISKITFGGEGSTPGKFKGPRGVAVSADGQIFVADRGNGRVQVFNSSGGYLRAFPTVVPGADGKVMSPCDVHLDPRGSLLLTGTFPLRRLTMLYAVHYSHDGTPKGEISIRYHGPTPDYFCPSVAADDGRYVIIAAVRAIMEYHGNGSFHQRFERGGFEAAYITKGADGRVFVTDGFWDGVLGSGVHVYDVRGRYLFRFGDGEGQLLDPQGVCTGPAGRVIVANRGRGRADMFTGRGEFVRSLVSVQNPQGIASGPGGLLAVTNALNNTVTIFPRLLETL